MSSIFLCHSSRDKHFVRKLAARLREAGVRVWLDEAEIKIGDSLQEKIGQAVDEMEYVGVVLSTHSIESRWVQKELEAAMQREFAEGKVVLPLLLEPVSFPPFLRDKLYADFTTAERFAETFPKLLEALGVEAGSHQPLESPKEAVMVEPRSTRPSPSPSEKTLLCFEDLSITDLDVEASYNPDPSRALWNMHLRLSDAPPAEWVEIFDSERQFPRHTMWRRAWIEGRHIVVHCVPEELEKYHFDDLLSDVDNANRRYRAYLTEQIASERRERERLESQEGSLQDLKKRLGF